MSKFMNELEEKFKAGKLTPEEFSKAMKFAYKKIRSEVELDLQKTNGNNNTGIDGDIQNANKELSTLQNAYKKLGENAEAEKKELLDTIKGLQDKLINLETKRQEEVNANLLNLSAERDGFKQDADNYKSKFYNMSLQNVANSLTGKLNLKHSNLAATDLVRDGVLIMDEVKDKDGKITGFKYKLNFEYEDEKTKQRLPSNFEGTDNDISKLIEGMKILATNKTASYNRLNTLYPIQENISVGAGDGGGFNGAFSARDLSDEQAVRQLIEQRQKK